jgi:peptide/nickel transport system permease protein
MSEATKIRLRERKSQPRKSWFRPAKTEKGKWLRFYCCLAAVALVLFIAFFGKYFAPYDPLATDYAAKLSAPGGSHLFGTDNVGRDVLSRILYGAGNSFILTFIMIAIVSVLGTALYRDSSADFWIQ